MNVDHLCRTKGCANPAHLELVSRVENVMRGESPAAKRARQTVCKRGHPLTEDNIYAAEGRYKKRRCKTCMKAWLAARRRREGMRPAPDPERHRRKLDKAAAREIKRLLRCAHDKSALAERFGVSVATIYSIASERTWADA